MTGLADALAEVREDLPRAAAVVAIPDTQPSGPGGRLYGPQTASQGRHGVIGYPRP